jgi:subtilisin family serine protease
MQKARPDPPVMTTKKLPLLLFFLFTLAAFSKGIPRQDYVEGEVLVRFRDRVEKVQEHRAVSSQDLSVIKDFPSSKNLYLMRTTAGRDVRQTIKEIEKDADVLYAQPNYIYRLCDNIPNDTYLYLQWALPKISAPAAWDITTGDTSIVIAVIDSGVKYDHPDLADNMWVNQTEYTGMENVDDDGNGIVDDIHGARWTGSIRNGDPMDYYGHGTHCAGIIGAQGNNVTGVCGVNWDVRIMALRFITSSSGTTADAIECINYVIDRYYNYSENIIAASNSWGGYSYDPALYDAIENLLDYGILFIAAAGNDTNDSDYIPMYPAGFYLPNIISVAATTSADQFAYFSNYGRRSVHISAPGSYIYSTYLSGYTSLSGTSMATPFVAGLAGLLKSADGTRNWIKIKNLILTGGDDVPVLSETISGRRINANNSLNPAGRTLFSRLRPIGPRASAAYGDALSISALNIQDDAGAGNVDVTINETAGTITLYDNGTGFDRYAGDGIYSMQWAPAATGMHTLVFDDGSLEVSVLRKYKIPVKVSSDWREFTGTNLNLTNDSSTEISIPFAVQFGGNTFTALNVADNGVMSFIDDVDPEKRFYGQDPPDDGLPDTDRFNYNTAIAPFWADFAPSSSKNIFWSVLGSAPDRELVIEWRDVPLYAVPNNGVTFQVVFFENGSEVVFNYQDVSVGNTSYDGGRSAVCGMQVSSLSGYTYSNRTASLYAGLSLLWETENIGTAPDTPVNVEPVGETGLSLEPLLTASDYSHPGTAGFAFSRWQVRRSGGSYEPALYDSGKATPSFVHTVSAGALAYGNTYYWRVKYKDDSGNWSDWSSETIFTTMEDPGGGGGGGGGGCFIATAAFGSPLERHVRIFREFRDRYLLTNPAGRLFVKWYYRHSPKYAALISRHRTFRVTVRIILEPLYLLLKCGVRSCFLQNVQVRCKKQDLTPYYTRMRFHPPCRNLKRKAKPSTVT